MELVHFKEVFQIVQKLREPNGGCPWDLEQTHQTLLKYLLEESYEFIDSVNKNDPKAMTEELGDVLLQVLLHCVIAEQEGKFDLEEVSKELSKKLIRRHPHVFGEMADGKKISASQVIYNWKKIKEKEKNELGLHQDTSLIPEKTLFMPALSAANTIGIKSGEVKFDWDNASQVAYKVEEEWQELKEEIAPGIAMSLDRAEEEIGDLLFSVAQLARHLKIDPEKALDLANRKFLKRFHYMEGLIKNEEKDILKMNQKEMDTYWDQAKLHLKPKNK